MHVLKLIVSEVNGTARLSTCIKDVHSCAFQATNPLFSLGNTRLYWEKFSNISSDKPTSHWVMSSIIACALVDNTLTQPFWSFKNTWQKRNSVNLRRKCRKLRACLGGLSLSKAQTKIPDNPKQNHCGGQCVHSACWWSSLLTMHDGISSILGLLVYDYYGISIRSWQDGIAMKLGPSESAKSTWFFICAVSTIIWCQTTSW